MTIEIVQYDSQHIDGVASVIVPIQQIEFGISITLDAQPDLQDISGFYQRGTGNFWVAVADNDVVGTIGLLDIGNNQAALRKMFVKPSFRGPEYRIAKRLLERLLDWCKEYRIRDVYLGTTAKFLAAHRFYEKHGCREIAVDRLPASFPIMAVDTKFYELRL